MVSKRKAPTRRSVKKAKRVKDTSSQRESIPDKRTPSFSSGKKGLLGAKKSSEKKKRKKAARRQRTKIRWPQFIVIFLLLVVVALAGLFVWNRWFRYDDAQDFQGTWVMSGTSNEVLIDSRQIVLTSDVSYTYLLDPWGKTVSYQFGEFKGTGVYRFSSDRTKLVIVEGGNSDWVFDTKVSLALLEPDEDTNPEATTVLVK